MLLSLLLQLCAFHRDAIFVWLGQESKVVIVSRWECCATTTWAGKTVHGWRYTIFMAARRTILLCNKESITCFVVFLLLGFSAEFACGCAGSRWLPVMIISLLCRAPSPSKWPSNSSRLRRWRAAKVERECDAAKTISTRERHSHLR